MNPINYKVTLIGLFLTFITSVAHSTVLLPMNCLPVPAHIEQLCFSVTESPHGPFDDVVIYRKVANSTPVLLGSYKGGVATFGGFGFSTGGHYMWENWAEEGHPYFIFYRTDLYLSKGDKATSLAVLDDYYFNDFHEFTDEGKVSYTVNEGAFETCPKTKDLPAFIVDKKTMTKRCLKYLYLKDNH